MLLLGGVDDDRCSLDRWRVLWLSWIVCSGISRVITRTGSWIKACCTTAHRILLSRRHVWGPVLPMGRDEVALRRASKRQLLPRYHHHLRAGLVDVGRSNGPWATAWLYSWSTGWHGWSVRKVCLSWLRCWVHLWRCSKNERGGLSRAVGSLCQSRRRGRVWDRGRSRYRLRWFIHFTLFCGSASVWRCVASRESVINM